MWKHSPRPKFRSCDNGPEYTRRTGVGLSKIYGYDTLQLFIAHQPLASSCSPFDWIVDSGASTNMMCERSWFMTFRPLVPPQPVIVGDGRSISATGIGRTCLDVDIGDDETHEMILQDVYYIPKLDGNLLSVSRLTNKGFDISFRDNKCHISKNGVLAALAHKQNTPYILQATPRVTETAHIIHGPSSYLDPEVALKASIAKSTPSKASLDTWHRQLGHAHIGSMLKLSEK